MELLDKISKISPSPGKVRILIATVLFLTVPFFVYCFFYVRNQATYFTSRDLRLLAHLSSQIATRVENVSGVFKNAADKFIESNEQKPTEEKTTPYVPQESNLNNRKALASNLEGLLQNGPQLVITHFESTNRDPIDSKKGNKSSVTLEVKQGSSLSLDLKYIYTVDEKRQITATATTDLNSLLLPVLSKQRIENPYDTSSEDEFANILIAEAATNGKVIFQLDSSEFRLISLDKLTTAEEGKQLDFSAIDKTSGVVDIKLAGSKFKLFLHPINLSVPQTTSQGKENSWIICGLVPADEFQKEVWAISYTVLIGFAFLPALAILGWPFLKLMLIGPKDRLRTADIYFLAFSILIGLSLLTFLGLYVYSYSRLETQMDGQLKQLSEKIRVNFEEELKACLTQLKQLNENQLIKQDLEKVHFPNNSESEKQNTATQNKPSRSTVFKELKLPQAYPYFDTAVWIDPQGEQRVKWTNNEYTTQLISVATRPYFSNLNEGRYRYFDNKEYFDDKKFWLEPILSRTTGRNEAEISQMVPGDSGWISAFDTRLISLMQPVLPSGYGFSLIDNEGKVLFHSDETRHLGENFFQECDYDRHLLSAVLNRSETPLSVQYLGRGYRLFTAPVNNFPDWSLIVFRDKRVLRTAFIEILTLSTLLFLVYSLILLTAVSIFYLLNYDAHARRAWLWPSREHTLRYFISVLVLLALSAISLSLILTLSGPLPAILTCLISFLGISFYLVNLRFNSWGQTWDAVKKLPLWQKTSSLRRRINKYDLAYALNLSFLLLLIAIIPSFAIFKFAYESEMRLLISHGQLTIANGLADRDERIRSRYANPNSALRDKKFIDDRLKLTWDVYDRFFFDTTRTESNGHPVTAEQQPPPNGVRLLVHDLMPLLKNSVVKRGLFNMPFVDGSRGWLKSNDDPKRLTFHADIGRPGETRSNHLNTLVPTFETPGTVVWLLFVVAFVPFYLWFYLIVKKVFLLDLHKPSSSSFQHWLVKGIRGNCFVILDAPYTQKRALNPTRFHVVDLERLADKANWAEEFKYNELPSQKTIAVDNFEYKLDDPVATHQKIFFLEKLLPGRRVLVISTADPTRYRFADGVPTSQNGADRWSGVISCFLKVYAEDNGTHRSFLAQIEAKRKEALLQTNQGVRPKREIAELFETLKAECNVKVPLQQIGLGILKQPGFLQLSREHLINRVASQARTYYYNIWNSCSSGERLTLLHLAKDRLLSPKDHDVEPLLRRGLIVRDPELRLMNESFRRFVKLESGAQFVKEYEKAKENSPWHNFKIPLLVAVVGILLFLFITQRDVYDSSLAAVTAITTAIPAVFKLLSFFQKESVNTAVPEEN